MSLAVLDFDEGRAAVVPRLNEAGVPVTAWLLLSEEDGYFCNLDNAPQAVAHYAAFRAWAHAHGLDFAGVALLVKRFGTALMRGGPHGPRAAVPSPDPAPAG